MLEVSKGSQILLEILRGRHDGRIRTFALPRSILTTLTSFSNGARKRRMHRHQALDDFLVVLPFLLIGVIIGVCFDLRRQSTQIHSGALPLDSLYWNLLACDRVLYHNYSLS